MSSGHMYPILRPWLSTCHQSGFLLFTIWTFCHLYRLYAIAHIYRLCAIAYIIDRRGPLGPIIPCLPITKMAKSQAKAWQGSFDSVGSPPLFRFFWVPMSVDRILSDLLINAPPLFESLWVPSKVNISEITNVPPSRIMVGPSRQKALICPRHRRIRACRD